MATTKNETAADESTGLVAHATPVQNEYKRLEAIRQMEAGPERKAAIAALTHKQKIRLLWLITLAVLIVELEKPNPTASMINSAREWLRDQGQTARQDPYEMSEALQAFADDEFPKFSS
jgi:hypothetical protein